jgi:hypothetical protein
VPLARAKPWKNAIAAPKIQIRAERLRAQCYQSVETRIEAVAKIS